MNLQIDAVNFTADKKLVNFVQNKVEKLNNVYDRVVSGNVKLKLDSNSSQENKIAEIKLSLPGTEIFAKKHSKTFEQAADLAVEALRRQIKRVKQKAQSPY